MTARRFFTAAGVVAVAGVAGAISYRHQAHLAATHGQGSLAVVWPLCVDGLIVVTSVAINTDRAAGFRARLWALAGFWIGVAVSVTTNWLATDGGPINHCVSAFPALAFLLAIESLSSKPRPRKAIKVVEPVEVTPDEPEPAATPAPERAPRKTPPAVTAAAKVAAARKRLPDASPAQIAARAGVSESTARRHLATVDTVRMASPSDPAPARMNGFHVLDEVSV